MFGNHYDPHHIPIMKATRIPELPPNITTLRFNEFGTELAAGTMEGNIFILDWATMEVMREWSAHKGIIYNIQWSFCGRYLLTSNKHEIRYFSVQSGFPVVQLESDRTKMFYLACANPKFPNQIAFLETGDETLNILTLGEDEHKIERIAKEGTEGHTLQLSFTGAYDQDGLYFISASQKGQLIVYDVHEKKILNLKQIPLPKEKIIEMRVARRNDVLFISTNVAIRRYRFSQFLEGPLGEKIKEQSRYSMAYIGDMEWHSIAISPSTQFLAASAAGKEIVMWSTSATGVDNPIVYDMQIGRQSNKSSSSKDIYGMDWHPLTASVVFFALAERRAYFMEYNKQDGALIFSSQAKHKCAARYRRKTEHRCGDAACPKASVGGLSLMPANYPGSVNGTFDHRLVNYNKNFLFNLIWETRLLQQKKRGMLAMAVYEKERDRTVEEAESTGQSTNEEYYHSDAENSEN